MFDELSALHNLLTITKSNIDTANTLKKINIQLLASDLLHNIKSRTSIGLDTIRLSSVASSGHLRIIIRHPSSERHARIHFWPFGESYATDIHNHRWDFASLILYGELTEETFSINPADDGLYHKYIHTPNPSSKGYSLNYIGVCDINILLKKTIHQGELNLMQHETFHRVYSSSNHGTATLMIEQPAIRSETIVIRKSILNHNQIARRNQSTIDTYVLLLEKLIASTP